MYYRNFLENKLLPYIEDAPLTNMRTNVVTWCGTATYQETSDEF